MSLFKVIAWRRYVDFGPLWLETCKGMLLADSSVGEVLLCAVVLLGGGMKYFIVR